MLLSRSWRHSVYDVIHKLHIQVLTDTISPSCQRPSRFRRRIGRLNGWDNARIETGLQTTFTSSTRSSRSGGLLQLPPPARGPDGPDPLRTAIGKVVSRSVHRCLENLQKDS